MFHWMADMSQSVRASIPWQLAYIPWQLAYIPWQLAYIPWQLAYMVWQLAYIPWQLAYMVWQLAYNGDLFTAGCYNGCVYTMLASTGSIHWCYSTVQQGDDDEVEPIKSSPVCDPSSGLVWVGSHDQHLYALDVEVTMHI